MRKAIVFASIMFFVAGSALATSGGDIDIDNSNDNRSSSSSTSNPTQNFTPSNTNTNTANGGAGGAGGHGGVGFGGHGGDVDFDSDIRNSQSQGQGQDQDQAQGQHQSNVGVNSQHQAAIAGQGQSQDASNKGNKQQTNVTVEGDTTPHQAPAFALAVPTGNEGISVSTPLGGGNFTMGSRFNQLYMLAQLKLQAGKAVDAEIAGMEYETQVGAFLWVFKGFNPLGGLGYWKPVKLPALSKKKSTDTASTGNAGVLAGGVQS